MNKNSAVNRRAGAIFLGDVSVSDARLILIPSVWNLRVSMAAGLYALLGICVLRFAVDERIRKRLVLCRDYTECPKKGVLLLPYFGA